MTYEEHREAFIELLEDEELLFSSIGEALDYYIEDDDRELGDQLASDGLVQRTYRRRIIRDKAENRAAMQKAGRAGNDKMMKMAHSLMADDNEWAKINGKVTLSSDTKLIPITVQRSLSDVPVKQLEAELASRRADEAAEEVEEQPTRIEFTE